MSSMKKCVRNHSPRFCQSCLPLKLFSPDRWQTPKVLLQHYPNSTLSYLNQKTAGSIPFAVQSAPEPIWGKSYIEQILPETAEFRFTMINICQICNLLECIEAQSNRQESTNQRYISSEKPIDTVNQEIDIFEIPKDPDIDDKSSNQPYL